ncbi:EamA family transporter [Janthinobacterium sp. RB2R34]|uniref:EamA family transporter n=1 Tax=Janthinobacterium sp. RB2R34 TaxID=3424193 RepID=UPI003F23B2BE
MTSPATTSPIPDGILLPSLAVLGGQISVNLGAAVAKHLFPVIGVEGITAYRVGFSALFLLAVFRPWRFSLTRKDVLNLLVYGSVLGLMNLLIYRAFALIPIGIAVAIEVTGPLAVAMLSSRRLRDLLAVSCAAFGLYLLLPLAGSPGSLNPVGVAYALGAATCWALYIIFGKRASSLQGGQAVAWGMTVAAMLTVPIGVAYAGTALLSSSLALMGLAIAMLSSALPYTLEIFALRRLPQGVFGMFSSAAPAVSALAAMAVLGEHLSLIQWLAIACIVLASAMAALGAQSRR